MPVSKNFSNKYLPGHSAPSIKITLLMRLQADDRCCMIKTDQRRNSESGIPAQNRSVFIIQSENETADLSQTR